VAETAGLVKRRNEIPIKEQGGDSNGQVSDVEKSVGKQQERIRGFVAKNPLISLSERKEVRIYGIMGLGRETILQESTV